MASRSIGQVGFGVIRPRRADPYPCNPSTQRLGDVRPRFVTTVGRHPVLEVEHDDVGAVPERTLEPFRQVAGRVEVAPGHNALNSLDD